MPQLLDLQYYETLEGFCPFTSWLRSLRDRKAAAKIKVRLDRVSMGNFGDHSSVGESVFELRIDYGPGYRVYFANVDSVTVLLMRGGTKKTQAKDIQEAKRLWSDFKDRKDAEDKES